MAKIVRDTNNKIIEVQETNCELTGSGYAFWDVTLIKGMTKAEVEAELNKKRVYTRMKGTGIPKILEWSYNNTDPWYTTKRPTKFELALTSKDKTDLGGSGTIASKKTILGKTTIEV